MRLAFLGLIAWLSVCLLGVGLFPNQLSSFSGFFTIAGLFGLVSAVGLSQAVKSELRAHSELLTAYEKQAHTDPLTGLGNRRAIDQDFLPALHICLIDQEIPCGQSPTDGGGFRISHIGWFACQKALFRHTNELGITSATVTGRAKNLVSCFKSRDIFAYGFNHAGKLRP